MTPRWRVDVSQQSGVKEQEKDGEYRWNTGIHSETPVIHDGRFTHRIVPKWTCKKLTTRFKKSLFNRTDVQSSCRD